MGSVGAFGLAQQDVRDVHAWDTAADFDRMQDSTAVRSQTIRPAAAAPDTDRAAAGS